MVSQPVSLYWINPRFLCLQVSPFHLSHYSDIMMSMMASQITSHTIVYSTVYSGTNQRKHQSSASLAFVWRIYQWLVNSPHKWPVTWKMFPFDDVIIWTGWPLQCWIELVLLHQSHPSHWQNGACHSGYSFQTILLVPNHYYKMSFHLTKKSISTPLEDHLSKDKDPYYEDKTMTKVYYFCDDLYCKMVSLYWSRE